MNSQEAKQARRNVVDANIKRINDILAHSNTGLSVAPITRYHLLKECDALEETNSRMQFSTPSLTYEQLARQEYLENCLLLNNNIKISPITRESAYYKSYVNNSHPSIDFILMTEIQLSWLTEYTTYQRDNNVELDEKGGIKFTGKISETLSYWIAKCMTIDAIQYIDFPTQHEAVRPLIVAAEKATLWLEYVLNWTILPYALHNEEKKLYDGFRQTKPRAWIPGDTFLLNLVNEAIPTKDPFRPFTQCVYNIYGDSKVLELLVNLLRFQITRTFEEALKKELRWHSHYEIQKYISVFHSSNIFSDRHENEVKEQLKADIENALKTGLHQKIGLHEDYFVKSIIFKYYQIFGNHFKQQKKNRRKKHR
ncbi:hypothetical protein BDC45DRAFT_525754 [Circinella umbellata]|nr:hypothetical protein BDC45DRAFT_525754 [Circinella umbellata]